MFCFLCCGEQVMSLFFFFQAEGGIRDATVTGVQTCALPIFLRGPQFVVETIPMRRARSIGSGSAVESYRKALEDLLITPKDQFDVMQFETHLTGGSVMALSTVISDVLERVRDTAVSEHLVQCFVRDREILWSTN